MEKPKFSVLGARSLGSQHLDCFRRLGVDILGVYDQCPAVAERLAGRLTLGARICRSPEEALDGVDAVVIAERPESVADAVVGAANAGKHVFCEKPLGLSIADVIRIQDVVQRNRVVCDFNFGYDVDPAVRFIADKLTAGDLGKVSSLCLSYHDEGDTGEAEPPRKMLVRLAAESPVLDSSILQTRLLERWFGPGEAVWAGGYAYRTHRLLPTANTQFSWLVTRHACGEVTMYRDVTWFTPRARKPLMDLGVGSPATPYWEIVGTKRIAYWLSRLRKVWLCSPGGSEPQLHEFPHRDNYMLKAEHFLRCLRREATPTCPPDEARRALMLAQAIDEVRGWFETG